jgi:uncharacterized membrane protein
MFAMGIEDFFQTYYIDPIYQGTGYNIVNTLTYAILLVFIVILVYNLLRHFKIKIDNKFFLGILPFIFLAGILRSFEDLLEATGANESLLGTVFSPFVIAANGTFRNILLVTPPVYLTMLFVIAFSLSIAVFLERTLKLPYHKSWFAMGSVLSFLVLIQLPVSNIYAAVLMLGIAFFWIVVILAAKKYISPRNEFVKKVLTRENSFILSVHMFDASTTFVALQFFDYFEQHVLPGFLISFFGPGVMFLLKLAVVSIVLYYIDKDTANEEHKKLIKVAILILGLGPGLRNFFRLVMGV